MEDKLAAIQERFQELERQLADPEVVRSPDRLREAAQEHSELKEIIEAHERLKSLEQQIQDNEELGRTGDAEIARLAREELSELYGEREELRGEIRSLLVPRDPMEKKNVILEIRAGTGGEEATLFARELFEMYLRYAEKQGWKMESLSVSHSEQGGIKEVIALIKGGEVYRYLQYESGVHRVQRVPVTESQGRIHTSAVTVAVLPEAEDVDVEVNEDELKVDVFRSQGAGGQHVNTTDSAVRITHLPTSTVVVCQDERSQHKNRAKAMKILKSRLLEVERERQHRERAELRKSMVRSGDRSEKIRTYNFPQGRITDHRIKLSLYKLERVMQGELDEIIDSLIRHDTDLKLEAAAESGRDRAEQ
ncbi:MAG: peptide chain release factor 1 [bacterium]